MGDSKIAGILIENVISGTEISRTIVGIGLNVNQTEFVSDAPNPVSLFQITGKMFDRKVLLDEFLCIFFEYYTLLLQEKEEDIRKSYMDALFHGDGYYRYTDESGSFEARIHSIEPTGHLSLLLRTEEIRRYAFKEVAFDVC